MNTISANVTDVARNFSDYINRACYSGEHFVLMRGGKPVAEINPLPKNRRVLELPDLLASLPRLSDNEIDNYINDMKKARDSVGLEDGSSWDA